MSSGSIRGPLGGWEQVVSRAGESIRVEVRSPELAIVVLGPEGAVTRAAIPSPRCGYGGHELMLSAEERYLALYLWSGNGDIAYELFSFRPALRHLASFGPVFGEGFGPVFSPDERLLALAWATNPDLDLTEVVETDDEEVTSAESVSEWGHLRVHDVRDGSATSCVLEIRVPAGFPLEGNNPCYPEQLALDSNEVHFRATWGEVVRVPLPLPASVVVQGPRKR